MPTPDEPVGRATSPSAMATSTQGAAVSSAAEAPSGGFRDREPPPPYDGEEPEATFTLWERNEIGRAHV